MSQLATNYLDPQTLAAVGPLELRARMMVEGLMTGLHRSPYLGFSVEFAQHRPYAPGDDLRRLDWKVFARTDKLYLKQYQKETNLDLLLLVDTSGSMAYGSGFGFRVAGAESAKPRSQAPTQAQGARAPKTPPQPPSQHWRKFDAAASLAATVAYLALAQQDRVGLWLFAQSARTGTRLSNAHDHWRAIVGALEAAAPAQRAADSTEPLPPDRGTDLGRLLDQVAAKLGRRSLIVLVSDLFDDLGATERGLARVSHRGHDVILLQVLDRAELTFPFRSAAEFVGLEGEGRLHLDPAALRQTYLEALGRHLRQVEELARRFRFDHLLLDSSEPLGPPLSRFLARRAAMLDRGK